MLPVFEQFIKTLFCVVMGLAGATMVAMAGAGILEIGIGVKLMYASHVRHLLYRLEEPSGDVAVQYVLKGIESIFLAPVAFLAILCISDYLLQWIKASRTGHIDARNVDDHTIVKLEAWTLNLMIAVVATDLIGRLISRSIFEHERVIAECFVIVVLTVVWWLVYGRRGHSPPAG